MRAEPGAIRVPFCAAAFAWSKAEVFDDNNNQPEPCAGELIPARGGPSLTIG